MIRLSQDVLDSLARSRRRAFVASVALRLRRFEAAAALGDDALAALAERAIAAGEGFGVTSAYDVERFAECLLTYGDGFPDLPRTGWAAAILSDETRDGRAKMTAISLHETFAARDPAWGVG